MDRIRETYDESYLDLCLEGLYDLMKLKEAIFRYRINYKRYNLYGKHSYIDEKFSQDVFNEYFVRNDSFVQEFNSIYDEYSEIIEQNKYYKNQTEMSSVIKAIRSILLLYSSLVENKEFERIFYGRVMSFEPLLILINDMKSEFQTILFGYAEIANSANSPVIATHASSKEINLNEPEVRVLNNFSYPDVRVLNTSGYRYKSQRQLLPKTGEVSYHLEATNVLPFKIEKVRTRNRNKKKPKFRNAKEVNKNTIKLRELIKERHKMLRNLIPKVGQGLFIRKCLEPIFNVALD